MVSRRYLGLGLAPDPVEPVTVDFGEWLPDLPELNNPGAIEALNVIASEGGYVPFRDLAGQAGLTLADPVRGALGVYDPFGSPALIAGTTTGIYSKLGAAFTNRYTTSFPLYKDYLWQFVQFGDNVVALHPQVTPQAGDVGGSSLFTPLGGSPPIAACGARVGDFLVLGNLENEQDPAGTRWPRRIRWSGFNNIDAPWVSDPATQADFNDMPAEGGDVVAVVGRETGTVFQQRSISRMSYVGLPTVFDIVTVEESRGALSVGSVVDVGAFIFFIAEDGFFIWNGTNSTPIGDNKVNRWFFSRLDYANRGRIVSALDVVNSCVHWAFPTSGNPDTLTDIITYSYKEGKFSHTVRQTQHIFSSATFDANLDTFEGNLDTDYPITFDDGMYRGGKPTLAGFAASGQYGLFNGAALAAVIDTGEFNAPAGKRVFVNSARPLVDVATPVITVQTARRDQMLGEAIIFDNAVSQEITGECPVLSDARYTRFRVNVPTAAVWAHARGIEVWRKPTGRR